MTSIAISVPAAPPPATAADSLSLRPASRGDVPFLHRLFTETHPAEHGAFATDARTWDTFVSFQLAAAERSYAARHPGASVDVVLLDGEPVGRLIVDRGTREWSVVDIALLTERRSRGLGTRLLGDVLEQASAAGMPVALLVERANRAQELYRRLGFEVVAGNEIHLELRWTPGLLTEHMEVRRCHANTAS